MSTRPRLTIRQRLAFRWLGVDISEDGDRWTAPRHRQALVERAFKQAQAEVWRDGIDLVILEDSDGLTAQGPDHTITLRWLS